MDAESEALQAGKLHRLPSGEWYVRCRHCDWDERLPICDEEEAKDLLYEWQRPMTGRHSKNRNWSCPSCRTYWDEEPTTTETAETAATDAAGSAGQLAAHAAAPSSDALRSEVEQLKAEVETLKAEVLQWRELLRGHMHMKEAHVNEHRLLKKGSADLRAEFTAAQHPPLVSPPPGIE